MLKLKDVRKDYKVASSYVHALKGVSLEFRANEFVCILGPSGCGKTTLLNVIGGLDHYDSGDLVIQGRSTRDFKDRDWDVYRNHRIGFIFQSYNLIPHQTVLGNVELALTIAGVGREERRRRAEEALRRVGLGSETQKRPNQLSGGQMQRVAIARALVNNPDILLADEPTGALDSKTSVEVMDLIKEISGERLVIMVTHNPELAEQYATRIVRLHDGLVEADSDPYDSEGNGGMGEENEAPAPEKEGASSAETPEEPSPENPASSETAPAPEAKGKAKKKKPRAKMGLLTSLALSARNLLTKKGRTVITSVGGSIGIISVCLVLALSNGFNTYIRRTEEEMLSYYPVRITESTFDMASVMTSFTAPDDMPDLSQIGDRVYVDSFLTGLANGMATSNNITPEYVSYVEGMDKDWYSAIQYGYGVTLTDNLFTTVRTSTIDESGIASEETTPHTRSLSALKDHYMRRLANTDYAELTPMAAFFGDIVNKMPGTSDFSSEDYGDYVRSQYEIVKGEFPKNINEAVLVVGENNAVTDLTLAQLGILEEEKFLQLFNLGEETSANKEKYITIPFEDIFAQAFKLYFNDEVYKPNPAYTVPSATEYPYLYEGERSAMSEGSEDGIPLKITGILRLKEGLTYGCLADGLNLTEATVTEYIRHNMTSGIVSAIKRNSFEINGEDGSSTRVYYNPPARNRASYYTMEIPFGSSTVFAAYDDSALRSVGGENSVNSISVFATDFDGKDEILSYLDAWNEAEGRAEEDKITYTDTVGLLMHMMQTMLDVITYVLVAFTAISLVVSSVMIGIITYVSVVERVKEIGVLRSLGASKQDIRNLFNAETFIIGLGAGLIGIAVTYLLSLIVNLIIFTYTGIAGIASLPVLTAFVMVAVSVILTLVSGLIPASAAAKKDPVIALRTE